MITESILKSVIEQQNDAEIKKITIPRGKKIPEGKNLIIVVTGVRRCGKSTFLRKYAFKEIKFLAVNFEDPRLESFKTNDFIKLESIAKGLNYQGLILDEVQNIDGWEKYARSANDRRILLMVTGSNAQMLSKELGSKLTGRYLQIEMFPFSYNEFLLYSKQKQNKNSFIKYLEKGGFPEYLANNNQEYLRTLFRDIIIRDIAVRRGIRNEHQLIRLGVHILSNVGKEFSYNNITKTLQIKSVRSTIDYCDYLQESYILELIPRFSFSIRQQLGNPKKAYCIDTALARANSLSFSEDHGRMLENAVYIYLRNKYTDILYFKDDKYECDFLIKKNEQVTLAVQVCWEVNENNIQREIEGLKQAISISGAREGKMITLDQEEQVDGIELIPAWKWCL